MFRDQLERAEGSSKQRDCRDVPGVAGHMRHQLY